MCIYIYIVHRFGAGALCIMLVWQCGNLGRSSERGILHNHNDSGQCWIALQGTVIVKTASIVVLVVCVFFRCNTWLFSGHGVFDYVVLA